MMGRAKTGRHLIAVAFLYRNKVNLAMPVILRFLTVILLLLFA